jgi:hypothetical protein
VPFGLENNIFPQLRLIKHRIIATVLCFASWGGLIVQCVPCGGDDVTSRQKQGDISRAIAIAWVLHADIRQGLPMTHQMSMRFSIPYSHKPQTI